MQVASLLDSNTAHISRGLLLGNNDEVNPQLQFLFLQILETSKFFVSINVWSNFELQYICDVHKADLPYSKNRKEEKEGSITLFKEEKRWYNYISTRMVFIVNKIVQIYN